MATITEDYVSFETAKLLKEKGFDEECVYFYDWDEEDEIYRICSNGGSCNEARFPSYYSMPTHQMAMKWLRETYRIDIVIEISDPSVNDRKYYCMIWDSNNKSYILDLFDTYEESVEAALIYCLENLI